MDLNKFLKKITLVVVGVVGTISHVYAAEQFYNKCDNITFKNMYRKAALVIEGKKDEKFKIPKNEEQVKVWIGDGFALSSSGMNIKITIVQKEQRFELVFASPDCKSRLHEVMMYVKSKNRVKLVAQQLGERCIQQIQNLIGPFKQFKGNKDVIERYKIYMNLLAVTLFYAVKGNADRSWSKAKNTGWNAQAFFQKYSSNPKSLTMDDILNEVFKMYNPLCDVKKPISARNLVPYDCKIVTVS